MPEVSFYYRLFNLSLEIMNVSHLPTSVTAVRTKALDITLVSSAVTSSTKNWPVSNKASLFDYCYIVFDLDSA